MIKSIVAVSAAAILAPALAHAGDLRQDRFRHADEALVRVQYERWDDRSANVSDRESRMRARIERGRQDGRITDREANRLYRQLGDIQAKERAFMSDGRLGRREEAELSADLDQLADNIRSQTRDSQRY